MEERLKKISETGGLTDLGIDTTVLDEDWDPAEHEVEFKVTRIQSKLYLYKVFRS